MKQLNFNQLSKEFRARSGSAFILHPFGDMSVACKVKITGGGRFILGKIINSSKNHVEIHVQEHVFPNMCWMISALIRLNQSVLMLRNGMRKITFCSFQWTWKTCYFVRAITCSFQQDSFIQGVPRVFVFFS